VALASCNTLPVQAETEPEQLSLDSSWPTTQELLNLPDDLLDPTRQPPVAEAGMLGLLPVGDAVEDAARSGSADHGTLTEAGRIIETHSQFLSGGGLVRTFTDVTERRIAEARIRHMAHHDPLTGLANRVLLSERLGELSGQPNAGQFGLVCLDLDGFKTVVMSPGAPITAMAGGQIDAIFRTLSPQEAETIRNARGGAHPDPVRAARLAAQAGAISLLGGPGVEVDFGSITVSAP